MHIKDFIVTRKVLVTPVPLILETVHESVGVNTITLVLTPDETTCTTLV